MRTMQIFEVSKEEEGGCALSLSFQRQAQLSQTSCKGPEDAVNRDQKLKNTQNQGKFGDTR